ncbi:group-specific protein [Neobacillus bataviensis LMG 21833]|uniref:Group-specific protein n=1 Tax=Neobacillus bataviensis LMG 21833 TaxID=1117379 RepID=K6DRI7_9BACI|nr:group-specific protein [Neobacillus bataviensis LMG 21833]
MVKNQWFNDLEDEVMIIIPGQEHPYLMTFDNENQPIFLTFQGDTCKFLGLLNFKP